MRNWQDFLKDLIVAAVEIIQKNRDRKEVQEEQEEQIKPDIILNVKVANTKSTILQDGKVSSIFELKGKDQNNNDFLIMADGFQMQSNTNGRTYHNKHIGIYSSPDDHISFYFAGDSETDMNGLFIKPVTGKLVKGSGKFGWVKNGKIVITPDNSTNTRKFEIYFDKCR